MWKSEHPVFDRVILLFALALLAMFLGRGCRLQAAPTTVERAAIP